MKIMNEFGSVPTLGDAIRVVCASAHYPSPLRGPGLAGLGLGYARPGVAHLLAAVTASHGSATGGSALGGRRGTCPARSAIDAEGRHDKTNH